MMDGGRRSPLQSYTHTAKNPDTTRVPTSSVPPPRVKRCDRTGRAGQTMHLRIMWMTEGNTCDVTGHVTRSWSAAGGPAGISHTPCPPVGVLPHLPYLEAWAWYPEPRCPPAGDTNTQQVGWVGRERVTQKKHEAAPSLTAAMTGPGSLSPLPPIPSRLTC